MEKVKRVLAIATVVVIVICVILTLVFAFIYDRTRNDFYKNAWLASAFCMFMLPIVIWVMFWIYRLLTGRGVKKEEKTEEKIEE